MCVRLSKERNSESVYTQIYDIVSIFNRKCSRAMIQCQVCHPDTSAQNGKVPDPQGYKCKSGGCNFVIGDCGLNPSTELKRYTYVLFYSLGKAQFALSSPMVWPLCGHHLSMDRPEQKQLEYQLSPGIEEIGIDRRWHFLGAKKTKDGSSRRWMITPG